MKPLRIAYAPLLRVGRALLVAEVLPAGCARLPCTFVLVALGHSTLTPIGAPDDRELRAQRLRERHHADLAAA